MSEYRPASGLKVNALRLSKALPVPQIALSSEGIMKEIPLIRIDTVYFLRPYRTENEKVKDNLRSRHYERVSAIHFFKGVQILSGNNTLAGYLDLLRKRYLYYVA